MAGRPSDKSSDRGVTGKPADNSIEENEKIDLGFLELLKTLKKGISLPMKELYIKEGETTPPKRYNSGSMILAMENAGQLIEDEELRAHDQGQWYWNKCDPGRDIKEAGDD